MLERVSLSVKPTRWGPRSSGSHIVSVGLKGADIVAKPLGEHVYCERQSMRTAAERVQRQPRERFLAKRLVELLQRLRSRAKILVGQLVQRLIDGGPGERNRLSMAGRAAPVEDLTSSLGMGAR